MVVIVAPVWLPVMDTIPLLIVKVELPLVVSVTFAPVPVPPPGRFAQAKPAPRHHKNSARTTQTPRGRGRCQMGYIPKEAQHNRPRTTMPKNVSLTPLGLILWQI